MVPYNFSDMPPKTHTFLRQRTIVHYPAQKGAPARRTLSFVIHICFTCNKQGRLFLHRSVRVVFSGAAPDKEAQLETVLEGPKEPVYSPWPKKRRPQVEAVAHGADSPGVTVESKTRGSRNTSNGGVLRKAKGVPTTLPKLRSGPTSPSRPPPLAMDGPVPFILDADGCCMPSPTENGSSKLKSPKSPQRLVELTTNAGGRSVSVVSLGGFGDGKSKVADGADGDPLEDDALY